MSCLPDNLPHAGSRLKVPVEVRNLIRRLPPKVKRKLRAALTDMLDDPAARVRTLNRAKVLFRSVTVMVTAVGSFRVIYSPAPLFSSSDVKLTIFFLL